MFVPDLSGPVTHIVPLGSICEITYNIRRYYQIADSYVFDWLGCPLDWTTMVLERNDPRLIIPENVTRIQEYSLSDSYGVLVGTWLSVDNGAGGPERPLLAHIFDRFGGFHPNYVEPARELIEARMKRFETMNAPGNRIMFIRSRYPRDFDLEAVWWPRFLNALQTRFDKAEWGLGLIGWFDPPGTPPPESVIPMPYLRDRAYGWKGNPAVWDQLLANLRLTYLGPTRSTRDDGMFPEEYIRVT